MTLVIALSLCLGATPQATLKLAMPGLQLVGIDADTGGFYAEHLAQQMKLAGAQVLTEREIASLLGLERQKQLLGCSEASSSCMAELASALGAEAMVLGNVAKVGARVQVNIKIVSASDGKTLALFSERVDDGEATVDALTRAAQSMVRQTAKATGITLVAAAPETGSPRVTRFWWIPVAAGAVAAGIGGVFLGQAGSTFGQLHSAASTSPLPSATALQLRDTGNSQQTIGGVLFGVGAGVAAVGGAAAVLHFVGSDSQVSVAAAPGGVGLSIAGDF